jgi:hypothetical protein
MISKNIGMKEATVMNEKTLWSKIKFKFHSNETNLEIILNHHQHVMHELFNVNMFSM